MLYIIRQNAFMNFSVVDWICRHTSNCAILIFRLWL